jgi:hypothetical protein
MVEVSLLGRVTVSVDGVPLSGEAAQRRRIALLVLLCVPRPLPISRDRLMLFLWPESDAESARHLLSVAVHVLRKALGHEVLLTTADEIALAPAAIRTDVAAFDDAMRRGAAEETGSTRAPAWSWNSGWRRSARGWSGIMPVRWRGRQRRVGRRATRSAPWTRGGVGRRSTRTRA